MRVSVRQEDKNETDPDSPVTGCPVRLRIMDGHWVAEIENPVACARTVAEMGELGPEARANLARHLETGDPQMRSDLKQMRKRAL
jgi:hypothetical protein